MTRKPTADELKPFFNQLHQLESAVLSGARRLDDVRPALQEIIEGRFHTNGTVSWTPVYEYRERLFERATERNWQLYDRDWDTLAKLEGVDHAGTLGPVSVEVWLGDLQDTFEELWLWVVDEVTKLDESYGSLRWDESLHRQKLSGPENLRFLPGAETSGDPKVTPIGLDLETHWDRRRGVRPVHVRTPETAAGLELFTLLALNPQIVPRMGNDLPHLWVPRLQATMPDEEAWAVVPVLCWNSISSKVRLRARWEDSHHSYYAVPVRREL